MRKNAWYKKHIVQDKRKAVCAVEVVESERGWGQKVDSVTLFNDRDAAMAYVTEYNKQHCPPVAQVPDWYMYARVAQL